MCFLRSFNFNSTNGLCVTIFLILLKFGVWHTAVSRVEQSKIRRYLTDPVHKEKPPIISWFSVLSLSDKYPVSVWFVSKLSPDLLVSLDHVGQMGQSRWVSGLTSSSKDVLWHCCQLRPKWQVNQTRNAPGFTCITFQISGAFSMIVCRNHPSTFFPAARFTCVIYCSLSSQIRNK